MAKQKSIDLYGMTGVGETLAKAKLDAGKKIQAVLSGSWTPYVLIHQDWLLLVTRMPSSENHQWGYKLAKKVSGGQDQWTDINWDSRDAAISAGANHLAQNVGSYEGLEILLSTAQKQDLDVYFRWQAEYATMKAKGGNDAACRASANLACGHT